MQFKSFDDWFKWHDERKGECDSAPGSGEHWYECLQSAWNAALEAASAVLTVKDNDEEG